MYPALHPVSCALQVSHLSGVFTAADAAALAECTAPKLQVLFLSPAAGGMAGGRFCSYPQLPPCCRALALMELPPCCRALALMELPEPPAASCILLALKPPTCVLCQEILLHADFSVGEVLACLAASHHRQPCHLCYAPRVTAVPSCEPPVVQGCAAGAALLSSRCLPACTKLCLGGAGSVPLELAKLQAAPP